MQNYKKFAIVSITIAGIFFATASKVGITAMLMASTFFLLIFLIAFLVWATRPPKTHRNQLHSFSLNFESKRIEFQALPNGLYQVNLCTKFFDELEASKWETSQRKGRKLVFEKISKKLQKHYFTNDKAIEISSKRLKEKEAKKLFFELLKASQKQSITNVAYISEKIENINKSKFFTANRVRKLNEVKSNIQAKTKRLNLTPTLLSDKVEVRADRADTLNSLWHIVFLQFNTVEMQVLEMAQNESIDTLFTLFTFVVMILVVIQYVTKLIKKEVSDFSNVQMTSKCSQPKKHNKPCYKKDIFK